MVSTGVQVSIENMLLVVQDNAEAFRGGKIFHSLHLWCKLTSDPFVLNIVRGDFLFFKDSPVLNNNIRPLCFKTDDRLAVENTLGIFKEHEIVEACDMSTAGHYSNIFPVINKDGTARIILNLKPFNVDIEYVHFKMDDLRDVLNIIYQGCFFAVVDLRHAYYSVPVRQEDRDWFRFLWKGVSYRYTCMPQGFADAPRIFTKLLKPVLSHLRSLGIIAICYIDDCIFVASSYDELLDHLSYAIRLFMNLGLTINATKSVLVPSRETVFLGFKLNSETMTIQLPEKKQDKIKSLGVQMLTKHRITIREMSAFIGNLVASEHGVPLASIHYKYLEVVRSKMLLTHCGDYDAQFNLDERSRDMIRWWTLYDFAPRSLLTMDITHFLFADASNKGWGATLGKAVAGSQWAEKELCHINVLELKAILLGLQALCKDMVNVHIRVHSDNSTAVSCIERGGSTKIDLCNLTEEIFHWSSERGISLSASHIQGTKNVEADRLSRIVNVDTEWALRRSVFLKLCDIFFAPDTDLFANRINAQVKSYVSWGPDPGAVAFNAFNIPWSHGSFYAFPPFSVIGRALRKLVLDQATVLMILPLWPSQTWFPRALHLLVSQARILPRDCLYLPQDLTRTHPLRNMRMGALVLSGDRLKVEEYRRTLPRLCSPHGAQELDGSMGSISKDGCCFVSGRRLIRLLHL